jgi:hypothetical protein
MPPVVACAVCNGDVTGNQQRDFLECGHVIHVHCWMIARSACQVCNPQRIDLMGATAALSGESPAVVVLSPPVLTVPPEDECSICLDPLSIGGHIALSCGHRFHPTCVSRLDGTQRRCAMCRGGVAGFPSQQSLKDSVFAENLALRATIAEMRASEKIVLADMASIVEFVEKETEQCNDAMAKLGALESLNAAENAHNALLQSDNYFLRDEVDLLREQQRSFVSAAAQLGVIASELVDESAGLLVELRCLGV